MKYAQIVGQGLGSAYNQAAVILQQRRKMLLNEAARRHIEIDRDIAEKDDVVILQGVVALILGKGGVSVGKGMASTGRSVLTKGIQGTADVTVADVVAAVKQTLAIR